LFPNPGGGVIFFEGPRSKSNVNQRRNQQNQQGGQRRQQGGGGRKPGQQQQQQPNKKRGPGEQQAELDKKWRELEDPSLLPDKHV
jgi:hypothetical protein